MRKIPLLVCLLVTGAVSAGCSSSRNTIDEIPVKVVVPIKTSMMKVSDQPRANEVRIDSLVLKAPGFVVIHADKDGKPGAIIGHSPLLPTGRYTELFVDIDADNPGARVFPMVHSDDGDGAYVFPGPDVPLIVDGKVLVGEVNWQ